MKLSKAQLLSWLPVALLVLLATLLTVPLLLGWRSYVILSGSMEPHYPVGSLVYVRAVAPQALATGDVVTFCGVGGAVVTHRIVATDPAAGTLTTKGDANTTPDPIPVQIESVLGQVVFCLPFAGYLSLLLTSPPGVVLAALAAGGIATLYLYKTLCRRYGEEQVDEEE